MKAIYFEQYGSPENLKIKEVEKPQPKDNEVLIKVRAASLNPYDWHHLRGMLPIKISMGFSRPKKNNILGADVAGVIEAIGKDVKQFKPGDEVFGEVGYGSLAEYVSASVDGLTLKPPTVAFTEAAAIPMVGFTGLQGLRYHGQPEKGQHILINGASGGIGTISVQLAKHFGAEVTAVSSTPKIGLVRSLGTDHVIDYMKEEVAGKYDLVMDNVGNLSLSKIRGLLKPTGKAAVTGYTNYKLLIQTMMFGGKRIKMVPAKPNQEDLRFLGDLMEKGHIEAVIDNIYAMEEAPDAMKKVASRHVRGKVVIQISN